MPLPALAPPLAALLRAFGAVSAPNKLYQLSVMKHREDLAIPLDWTAQAKGEPDDNPEYIVKIRPDGTGETNRGRLLLPEDVKHFKDLERGPDRWQLYLAAVERRDRRYQNREPSVSSLTEIADQPGYPGQPLDKEQQWALMRFA